MNEISILMYMLTRKKSINQIGATEKEILKSLNVKNKNKSVYFQDILTGLSKYLEPLGLQIHFNSLNSHWFVNHDTELTELITANPFEGRPSLSATLLCILTSCLKNSGHTSIQEIRALRNKKDIKDDIKILEKEGFLELDKKTTNIRLTPLIGYKLDLQKLFVRLALKLKE
ncbi:MAG: hypothetical protein ACTSQL_06845 [Promethearchaeota archaeon]